MLCSHWWFSACEILYASFHKQFSVPEFSRIQYFMDTASPNHIWFQSFRHGADLQINANSNYWDCPLFSQVKFSPNTTWAKSLPKCYNDIHVHLCKTQHYIPVRQYILWNTIKVVIENTCSDAHVYSIDFLNYIPVALLRRQRRALAEEPTAWHISRLFCYRPMHQGPLFLTWFNFNPAWISNYIHYKMLDEITNPFLNFNDATVEV